MSPTDTCLTDIFENDICFSMFLKEGSMKKRAFNIVTIILLLGIAGFTVADDVSQNRAEATIRFLADDLLEGRGTPSRGLDIAALYLANELREAGWEPANEGSYLQTYALRTFSPQDIQYTISINSVQLESDEYIFAPFAVDPSRAPFEYDLMFAGYGIFAPEKDVDDFAGMDLSGKAVVSLRGAPWELVPHVIHAYDRVVGKMVHVTVRNGAFLVYVSHELDPPSSAEVTLLRDYSQITQAHIPEFEGKPTCGLCPVLVITPAAFDRVLGKLIGGTYEEWQTRLPKQKFKAQDLNTSLKIDIKTKTQESTASNVVAMLRGTDPSLADEWIVLTAHYDHLGKMEVPPDKDGIWNGADDNASGTAAVLEIAKRLKEGKPSRRSILVVFTSGEELGLLGSAYYARHPLVPNDRVIANINVDMVGRSQGAVYALATGSEDLFAQAADIGGKKQITVRPDPFPAWRIVYFIDSYHFARFDIPFVEFFTDFHADYHQPTDEIRHIRFAELGKIMEVMFDLTSYYAQGGERPKFLRPVWFLTTE